MARILVLSVPLSLALLAQVACTNSGLGLKDTADSGTTDDTDATGTGTGATAAGTGAATGTGTGSGAATATGTGTGATGTGTGGVMTRPIEVRLILSVDGAWEAEVDGRPLGMSPDWNFVNIFNSSVNITDPGPHVVAVHARALEFAEIVGLIAEVRADDETITLTGDGQWKVTSTRPTGAWTEASYDSSSWTTPTPCAPADVSSEWGTAPVSLTAIGAEWVWYQPCKNLGEAWFRYEFTAPIP